MTVRTRRCAAAALAFACAACAADRVTARMAPPPIVVSPLQAIPSGDICIDFCPRLRGPPVAPALVVVDGTIVMQGTASPLNDIDPRQIAHVELIRGPGAVERYGAAAAEGVVLITLKHDR